MLSCVVCVLNLLSFYFGSYFGVACSRKNSLNSYDGILTNQRQAFLCYDAVSGMPCLSSLFFNLRLMKMGYTRVLYIAVVQKVSKLINIMFLGIFL